MATFTKINAFVEALAEKVHNLGSDQLKVALTNTAHTSTWGQLSDLTEIHIPTYHQETLLQLHLLKHQEHINLYYKI